jgi:hypothetical protein
MAREESEGQAFISTETNQKGKEKHQALNWICPGQNSLDQECAEETKNAAQTLPN